MEVKKRIMQAQVVKGAFLNEAHLKVTTQTIKEITPFGIRGETNYAGEVRGPSFYGRNASTVSLFLRTDGTFDWESKSLDTTKEGDIIVGMFYGTGKMTGPNTNKVEGEVIYMTQSQKLSWLNNKKCRVEGTGDSVTGEAHVKIFAL